jgi:hypothetical protein
MIRPFNGEDMKFNKVTFWGFLIAGVLYIIGGLRDIFAPGFFNMSPQIPSTFDIVVKFVLAGGFFALAALSHANRNQVRTGKK